FTDTLAGFQCELDRLKLVVIDKHRVVEEHHQPVAREVLESPIVVGDQFAYRPVILPEHLEQFLRLRSLDETREAAEIREEHGDVGTVASQQLLPLRRGDQVRYRRREKARQL